MSDYHESWDALPEETRDIHRAIKSLCEELEAVDWYHQRISVCQNPELRGILAHNRDEEIEHAAMTLEWLRRNMNGWDEELRTYLFSEGPVIDQHGAGDMSEADGATDLGIGSLKGDE